MTTDNSAANGSTADTTKCYRVTGIDIRHHGQHIREGQRIDLTNDEADQLSQYLVVDASSDGASTKTSHKSNNKEAKNVA